MIYDTASAKNNALLNDFHHTSIENTHTESQKYNPDLFHFVLSLPIYEAKTYLTHLSSQEDDAAGDRDCQNLLHFFGCPDSASRYLTSFSNSMKRHK